MAVCVPPCQGPHLETGQPGLPTRCVMWLLYGARLPHGSQEMYSSQQHGSLSSFRAQLLRWCGGKESTCQSRRCERLGFSPWVGKIPWRREQLTPVFLPGESYGQRSWWATVHRVTKSRTRLNTRTQGVAPETPVLLLPQTLWGEAVTSLPRSKGRNVDLNSQCRESRRIMQPFIKTALERVEISWKSGRSSQKR